MNEDLRFDYHLPPASIAQTPLNRAISSGCSSCAVTRERWNTLFFRDIGKYLNPGDLLVLNQTRVIPARIYARKPTGGRVEILLLRREDLLTWECLVGGKGLSVGKQLIVESDDSSSPQGNHRRTSPESPKSGDFGLRAEIIEVLDGSRRRVRFTEPIEPYLPKVGNVPLPPYIHEKLTDPERYQTVYAREPGSAAAPTAGLHFTPGLLQALQAQGVRLAYVTLHVGLDTFAPVTEEDPAEHEIHTEWCHLPQETADAVNAARRSGGRVIAVGTTSVRTLESAAVGRDTISSHTGNTNLYITPGYPFQLVDCMITNFHLPRSTLIMLVSAFAGRERVLRAYETAIREGYRFYSFGDAMLIL